MSRAAAGGLSRKRVAVLPDLFVDAIAHLPAWNTYRHRLGALVRRGGGNLPIGPVELKAGGNATNLAIALARLGARVELITETDRAGRFLLEEASRGTRLGLDLVRVSRRASATVALEFGRANAMLSHAGPLRDFGPERLTPAAWKAILAADAVAVTNWAQNRRGTELLAAIAQRLRGSSAFLFVDPSDPRHRGKAIRSLLGRQAIWRRVDALGLNVNELGAFTGDGGASPAAAARRLHRRLGCRIDLHTRRWALSVDAEGTVRVPALRDAPRRLTGAGDAWNAGNLAGYLLALAPRERLRLAHRTATAYLTSVDGRPPAPTVGC